MIILSCKPSFEHLIYQELISGRGIILGDKAKIINRDGIKKDWNIILFKLMIFL